MRAAKFSLRRFIGTPDTSRQRPFVFLAGDVLPDAQVYCIAIDDAIVLGALSSCVHQTWVIRVAPRLGVGNDIRWKPKDVWASYPFPSDDTTLTPTLTTHIRALAEQLDAHRKTQQAAHPELTLTGMYNVLVKLRSGEPLNAKDKLIHTQGLVSVLKSLHDELDAAVLQAYGWADLTTPLADHRPAAAEARAAAVETLLERLVALNAKRAAEEATGTVRWLRPDFQQRAAGGTQTTLNTSPEGDADEPTEVPAAPPAAVPKRAWPSGLPEQIKAVAEVLSSNLHALTLTDLEARFNARGRWRDRLPTILDTLQALGRARQSAPGRWQAV